MPRRSFFFVFLFAWFATAIAAHAQIASFPGAVGYGGTTTGAWTLSGNNHVGGTVYHVTNLNDSGPGSFRTGVATGGAVIVFDVGGSIQALTPISTTSNISIEGQTAPGGIQIFGSEVSFTGRSNIICRYVHFRDGTLDPNYPGSSSTNSHTNAAGLGTVTNIIFDHCSFEFAAYNNIDAVGAINMTIQNCLFGDPIKEQQFNCHFEGGPATFIDNLWANSHGRNPLAKGDLQYVNNIIYNYGYAFGTGNSVGVFHWDIVNNYFISGPSTSSPSDAFYQIGPNQQAYAIGNYLDGNDDGVLNGSPDNSTGSAAVLSTYYFPNSTNTIATTSLPTVTATAAFYQVVSNAGPVPRDQVDSQIVSNVLSIGTAGTLWVSQVNTGFGNSGYGVITGGVALPDSDASGMPDDWKSAEGLSLTNPGVSGSTSATGYTNLENYLAWKALPNAWVAKNTAAQPTSVQINLSQYANGFGAGSTYIVSGTVNGTVAQAGSVITFTPKLNTSGLGGFNWSVSNGITSLTSTCGILISQSGPSQSVTWKGDSVNNFWDSSSNNWKVTSSGSTTTFGAGDPVTFDDTGFASPSINIDTAVAPGNMTFRTFANNYTLTGSGSIGGSGELVKEGTGTLSLSSTGTNTFSGGAILNSGTININGASALGTGAITLNGGDLEIFGSSGALTTISNAVTVNVPSTFGVNTTNADIFISSAFSGSSPLAFDLNSSGIVCTPQGSWVNYTGILTLNGAANFRINNSSAWGFPNASLIINGAVSMYNRSGGAATIPIGQLIGPANSSINGSDQSSSAGTVGNYVIGALNQPSVFAGNITNSTNQTVAISATGSSTLTLSGDDSYTGATTIYPGSTLILTGTLGKTNVVINSGASFISSSVVNGSVTLNAGGSLFPGNSSTPGIAGTLTTGTALALAGGTGANIYYDLSPYPTATGSNDLITVTTGTFSLSGIINFNVALTNGTLGAGTYNLINGSAIAAGSPTMNLVLPIPAGGVTRQTFGLSRPSSNGTNIGFVNLTVSGSAGNLTWTGSNGGVWDLNTTANNWSGGTTSTFYDLDSVTFNDSTTNGAVTVTGTLAPAVVNVNNNTTNYVLTGSGGLAANAQIIKSGAGTLTIANTGNVQTGNIYLNGGTLVGEGWLGTGTIYLNGGVLSLSGNGYNGTFGNSIVVNQNSTINGSGNVYILNNTGDTLTSATNNITLFINASGGIFSISNNMTGFAGTIEMGNSTAGLRINGGSSNTNLGDSQALFDLGPGTSGLVNRNGNTTISLGALAGGPGTYLNGRQTTPITNTTSTYVVGFLNTNTTFGGSINNGNEAGVNITKVGTGNWTLSGTSNWDGDIAIQQGTLIISGSDNNGGFNFEAMSGASFKLAGGTVSVDTVQIDTGATFTGNGTINGQFTNQGSAILSGSAPLIVNGGFENDGSLIIDGGSSLVVNLPSDGSGSFVNTGILDIMDSPSTVLPAGLVNTGTILNSSLVAVKSFSKTASNFSVSIQSYSGHTYQLQKSNAFNSWTNVGSVQGGNTGSAIVLSDTAASTSAAFYRIGVGP